MQVSCMTDGYFILQELRETRELASLLDDLTVGRSLHAGGVDDERSNVVNGVRGPRRDDFRRLCHGG